MKNSILGIAAITAFAVAANAQAFNWVLQTPTAPPAPRERVATATDGTLYYLYGGQNNTVTAGLDELWSFDGTSWVRLTTSGTGPGTRAGAIAGYDTARGKLVLFGGKLGFGATDPLLNDTWEWDAVSGWVQILPTTSPDRRWLVNNCFYVPGLGVMFHGGTAWDATGATYLSNETWLFTGGNWLLFSSSGPAAQDPMVVYRSTQNDLLLHGGQTPTGVGGALQQLGQTWRLDLATGVWTQLVTATTPTNTLVAGQGLFAALSYYNPNTGTVIVHGGNGGNSSSATWQFDGADWRNISTNGVGARNGGMHWINALGRAVYGPCNETNGARNRTRSHGPTVVAAVLPYGAGCSGQAGTTLSLAANNSPWTALSWSGTCTGMSVASPLKLAIWGSVTSSLPVTGLLGAGPGCTLLNSAEVIEVAFSPTTSHTIAFAIPASPSLAGIQINTQVGELDFALLGLALSNGLSLTIGG